MAKKTNWITYAMIAAGGGIAYLIYRATKKGKSPNLPELPPTPTPTPTPTPVSPPIVKSKKPSFAKATELQKAIIRRYTQLNRSDELPKNFADGDFGDNSNAKLQFLRPETYKNFGAATSTNVDKWINAINSDIAAAAKQETEQKTKQATKAENIKLAADLVNYTKTGKKRIKLLNDYTAVKQQYDAVRNRYINLGTTKKFFKNSTYGSTQLVDRGDGSIGIMESDFRYFVPASQFITVL